MGMITTLRKQRQEPPADVIDMLFACHDRIRRLARLAERVSGAHDFPAIEIQQAAYSLVRYFRHALPLHAQDEDLTLRPRLHEIELGKDVREALVRMSDEHDVIDRLLEPLFPCWEKLASDGSALSRMPSGFAADATRLRKQLDAHLALEEETIFPALRRYLSADSEAVIAREMRARRAGSGPEVRLADEAGG